MKKAKAILIVGNSPNRLHNRGPSWDELLQQLHREVGMAEDAHKDKPATLHYDEMVHHYAELKNGTRKEFAELVARKMKAMQANDIHRALMALPFQNILTTNYDYCLEQAAAAHEKADFRTKEVRYSLFRRRKVGARFVWHIHGEIERPSSIMLGHESYIESASRIRRYCDPTLGIDYRSVGNLQARFKDAAWKHQDDEPHSWVDLFMTSNVHIVGLSMDFSEADLWYLMSFKRRMQRDRVIDGKARGTKIIFHDFDSVTPAATARRELLQSFGAQIVLHSVRDKDYSGAWKRLIKKLGAML